MTEDEIDPGLPQLPVARGEYEATTFSGISLVSSDLCDAKFIDCVFERCALSSVKFDGAVLQTKFQDSKIEGINFFTAKRSLLNISFQNCLIRYSSFAELRMKSVQFIGCTLQHVDFADCDLTESDFSNTTFEECVFQNTNLTKANFVTASGYAIDPRTNNVRKARFSIPEVVSLLSGFGIEIE